MKNNAGVGARRLATVLLLALAGAAGACSSSQSGGTAPKALAGAGAPCNQSADCQGSLRCVRGTCTDQSGAGGAGGSGSGGTTGQTGSGGTSGTLLKCVPACSPDADCVKTGGTAQCVCHTGYSGDGVTCTQNAVCGDGKCDPQETCSNCPQDCGGCACTACTTSADCPSGSTCALRNCDGVAGCFDNASGATCDTIGGQACPPSQLYGACSTQSDCGQAICLRDETKPSPTNVCTYHCDTDANCPDIVPPGSGLTVKCVENVPNSNISCAQETGQPASNCYVCVVQCSPGATCPPGMLCNGC